MNGSSNSNSSRIVFGVFVLLFVATTGAHAQTISVQTDKSAYDEGDEVVVSGLVSTVFSDETQVLLRLFSEGNRLIQIGQIDVAQDGSYTYRISTGGGVSWAKEGEYTVTVSYGEGSDAEARFEYYPKREDPETTDSFEVDAGSSGTFDVEYTMRGGTVKDMYIDPRNFAIRVAIDAVSDGEISLNLPRSYIDAKERESDIKFIILVDEFPVPYEEPKKDLSSRVVTVPFEEESSDIMIIGTYVIPEFGAMAMAVLAAVITATIFLAGSMRRIRI